MKTLTYQPGAGCHIDSAIYHALKLAAKYNRRVEFRFNGLRMRVNKRLSVKHLSNQFHHMMESASARYRCSQRRRKDERERREQIAVSQGTIDGLLIALPDTLRDGSLSVLMVWLDTFTTHADWIGVKYDTAQVAADLEGPGYKKNEGVGNPPEWFNTQDRMGRYIIGQAINCLRIGMGPHSVTHSFIEKFNALAA